MANDTTTYIIVFPIVTPLDEWPWGQLSICTRASARALDAGKPIKEPQAHCARNIKNHLADLGMHLILCYGFHRISLCLFKNILRDAQSLTDFKSLCYSFSHVASLCQRGKKYEEKLKSVRHYSFGWNGCQYNFGRVLDPLLLWLPLI